MRLLDRYLLRELVAPLGFCLGGFLVFWIAFDLFSDLGRMQVNRLRAGDIAEYYLVKAPEFVVVVLPLSLLLALLYSLTSHARHHELTAIRAAGVSLWRLSLPYFGVGLAASLVLFAMNELWVPQAAERAERILSRRVDRQKDARDRHRVRDFGFKNARDERTWQMGLYDERTGEMFRVEVDWIEGGARRWMFADRAALTNGAWTFFNVREFRDDPRAHAELVPSLQTNVLTMPAFSETPDEIRSEIRIAPRLGLRGARKADMPVSEILDYLRLHPNPARPEQAYLYTKLHGRLAAPWTCLVVVVIALPFGAASGRRNIFVGVAGSIFICLVYFLVLQLGLALGAGGYLPAWLAGWFPNLGFGLAGLWLTGRVR